MNCIKTLLTFCGFGLMNVQATEVVLDIPFTHTFTLVINSQGIEQELDFSDAIPTQDGKPEFNEERLGELQSHGLSFETKVVENYVLSINSIVPPGVTPIYRRSLSFNLAFSDSWDTEDFDASDQYDGLWFNSGDSSVTVNDTIRLLQQWSVLEDPVQAGDESTGTSRLKLTANATSTPLLQGVTLGGVVEVTLNGKFYRYYKSKTLNEYIEDALNAAMMGSSKPPSVIAQNAYADVISLRETDSATSSTNIELRDAEYFLRGYRGGRLIFENAELDYSDLNDLGDAGGPYAWTLYNGIKTLKIGLGLNISGEGKLPATPVGGYEPNLQGWRLGKQGLSVPEVLQVLRASGASLFEAAAEGNKIASEEMFTGISETDNFVIEGEAYTSKTFSSNVDPIALPVVFDLSDRSAHAFSVFGNRFKAITLSPDLANADTLVIAFLDATVDITGAASFDFTPYSSGGVDTFVIVRRAGNNDNPGSSVGVQFITAGDTVVNVTGSNVISLNPDEFSGWQALTWPRITDSNTIGPLADPDGDGVVNLIEWSLGQKGAVAGSAGLPEMVLRSVGGVEYFAIQVRRAKGRLGVAYGAEVSDDLSMWRTAILDGSAIDNGDHTETVVFRDTVPLGGAARFIRLKVNQR